MSFDLDQLICRAFDPENHENEQMSDDREGNGKSEKHAGRVEVVCFRKPRLTRREFIDLLRREKKTAQKEEVENLRELVVPAQKKQH